MSAEVVIHPYASTAVNGGSTTLFTCLSYGIPTPSIVWSQGGYHLSNGTHKNIEEELVTENDSRVVFVKSLLRICNTEPADSGSYSCIANNTFQETLQIQLLVCVPGEEVRALLAYSTLFNVTLGYLQDAFAIQYSDNGSNKRTQEEAIEFHWFEYISNCEGNVQDYLTPSLCQLHAKPYVVLALCCDL